MTDAPTYDNPTKLVMAGATPSQQDVVDQALLLAHLKRANPHSVHAGASTKLDQMIRRAILMDGMRKLGTILRRALSDEGLQSHDGAYLQYALDTARDTARWLRQRTSRKARARPASLPDSDGPSGIPGVVQPGEGRRTRRPK